MASLQFVQPYHSDSKSSNLTFRPFVPNKSRYAARITEQQWDHVRPTLERLHKAGKTRAMMLEVLSNLYDFRPSMAQLNARMVVWNYKVNDHVRQTQPTDNHDSKPHTDLEVTSNHLQVIREADSMTNVKHEGIRSNYEQCNIVIGQKVREHVLRIVPAAAQYEQSAWFCIFYDINSLLLRPNWCSMSFGSHIQHLMHFAKYCDIQFTEQARALILRDCLRWTKDCEDPYSIDWVFGFYADHLVSSDLKLTDQRRMLLSQCHELYVMKGSCQSWSDMTADGDLPRPIAKLYADIESSALPELVLHSYGNVLSAVNRVVGPVVLDETHLARELVHWCIRATENFALTSALMVDNGYLCACDMKCYLHTALAAHLLKAWTEYADSTAKGFSHMESQTGSSWADLELFKTISAVLVTISFLVTEKALRKSCSILDYLRQDKASPPPTSQFVRNTLRTAFLELALHPNLVLEKAHCSKPSFGCDRKDIASATYVPAYAITFACETFDLRHTPGSTRHQLALEMLVNGNLERGKVKVDDNNSNDPMLSRMSSTSSFQSFRRSGVKLEAQRGAPSISSGSSKYSCGSSFYMIME